jgi:hypothetical protein
MKEIIYGLCALTSLSCAWLLLRSYFRNKHSVLLWSGLCFVGLSVNNVLLVLDKIVFPDVDLSTWRLVAALSGPLLLLYGLISEEE